MFQQDAKIASDEFAAKDYLADLSRYRVCCKDRRSAQPSWPGTINAEFGYRSITRRMECGHSERLPSAVFPRLLTSVLLTKQPPYRILSEGNQTTILSRVCPSPG